MRSEIKFENLDPAVIDRIYAKLLDSAATAHLGIFTFGKIAGPAARGAYDGVTVWNLNVARFIIDLLEQESYV